MLVAGERRLVDGGQRVASGGCAVTVRGCGAGPYPEGRYVSAHVSKISENNKNPDTSRIRIGGVSDTYRIRDTRLPGRIRVT
jgi:hypothetical protein